jgi:hypothetical protein
MYLVCDSRPVGQNAALEEAAQLSLDEAGHRTIAPLLAGQKRLEALADGLVENELLRIPRMIGPSGA